MNVDFDLNIPIYIQLLDYIKTYIICGYFKAGEKIPSVRELANMFKVNPNTVSKALSELEDIRLIYTERTNGKYVTNDKNIIEKIRKEYAEKVIKDYFDNMMKIGINHDDALNYLNRKDNE